MNAPSGPAKVSFGTKVAYGFGSVAFGVKDNGFRFLLLVFYNQVVGLDPALVSTAILAAFIVDSILDPIVGQVSDNWRSKWGRRHPFMYASAVPAAASFWMLWHPPAGWSPEALVVYLFVLSVIVRSFITLYEVPSSALVNELSTDYNERTAILGYRHFFGWWGGLILYGTALLFFFVPTQEYPVGQLNPEGYEKYAWLASAMMLVSIVVSALGTHRRIAGFHQPPARKVTIFGTFKEMLASFSHRSYLVLMGAGIFAGVAIGVAAAMYIYFSTYFWELKPAQMAFLLLDSFVASWLALILTPKLAARMGKRNAKIFTLVLAIAIGVTPYLLRLQGWWWPNGDPMLIWALLMHGVIYGVFSIGTLMLTSALIADVAEDSQVKTGRRSEGLFFSGALLVQKAVSGVGIFVTGLMLGGIGFPQNARPGQVAPEILANMVYVYIAVIGVLYAVSIWFLSQYKLTKATHEENLRKIREQGEQIVGAEAALVEDKPKPQTI